MFTVRSPVVTTLLLILAAIVTMYIVLGVLYESYIHPITILSTLPSATVGAPRSGPPGFLVHTRPPVRASSADTAPSVAVTAATIDASTGDASTRFSRVTW